MKLEFTKSFVKRYKKLDARSQKIVRVALEQMELDLTNKSLRVEKMKGYSKPDIWESIANMDLRITFEFVKPDTLILRNCGHHDQTLNNP